MFAGHHRVAWAWLLVAAIASVWLVSGLPSSGFFSGDSGVKLIAARNAIAHPARPFQVDLPAIGGKPVPYLDPLFEVHGDHAHPIQSPLFPLLSAVPIAAFGLRGAYVLPIASFLLIFPFLNVIRRHAAPAVSIHLLAILALLASPAFFYALEFWEHAPAVACMAASTALVVAWPDRTDRSPLTIALAGLVGGLGILLRPEAFWYVVPLAWLCARQRTLLAFAAGGALVLVPFALANLAHYGNVSGPHVSVVLRGLGESWLTSRWHYIDLWFLPESRVGLLALPVVATAWIGPLSRGGLRQRQVVALAGAAAIAVAAINGLFNREAVWSAWPAAALLLVPFQNNARTRSMWLIAVVSLLAIILTAAHDGGAQWGPRFLLVAAPAAMILAACAAHDAIGPGKSRHIRVALVAVVVLAGVWTTRAAYRELRGTKQFYARLVAAVDMTTEPGDDVIASAWWFDQVVAPLYQTRTFLFAADGAHANRILKELSAARRSKVWLVWSRETDGIPLDGTVADTCFHVVEVQDIEERSLTMTSARC